MTDEKQEDIPEEGLLGWSIGKAIGLLELALGNTNGSKSKNGLIKDAISELKKAVYKLRTEA